MQCAPTITRNTCRARNAYDPAQALNVFVKTVLSERNVAARHNGCSRFTRRAFHTRSPSRKDEHANEDKLARGGVASTGSAVADTSHHSQQGLSSSDGEVPLQVRKLHFSPTLGRGDSLPEQRQILETGIHRVAPRSAADSSPTKGEQWKRHMLWIRDTAAHYNKTPHEDREKLDLESIRARMEYEPKAIWPRVCRTRKRTSPWAVPKNKVRSMNSDTVLRWEIQKFGKYMRPTPAEHAARQAVLHSIGTFIDMTLNAGSSKKTGYELFGSEKTGLALPFSDIDIRVFDATGGGSQDPARMQNRVKFLHKALLQDEEWESSVYRRGFYPIICCRHRASGLEVQIVSSPSTASQQEVTARYLAEEPALKDLFMVMHTFFSMRGLLDVYTGGLGSYGTFVSLLAVVKRATRHKRDAQVDDLFLRYLMFYERLDTTKYGISVFPRTLFKKHNRSPEIDQHSHAAQQRGDAVRAGQWHISQRREMQPYLLCLQDPADPRNDLGKRSHAIKHIRASMYYCRGGLWRNMNALDAANSRGAEWKEESLLTPLVGRCHEVYAEPRKKLEEFGRKVLEMKRKGDDGERVAAAAAAAAPSPESLQGQEKSARRQYEQAVG